MLAKMGTASLPQRRWRRYDFDVPVTILVERPAARIPARATSLNEGGFAVQTDAELCDELRVEFTPPFCNTRFNVAAAIRNRNANRYGVEFLAASEEEQQELALLRLFVRQLASRIGES